MRIRGLSLVALIAVAASGLLFPSRAGAQLLDDVDWTAVHRLTVQVNAVAYDDDDCIAFCVFEPPSFELVSGSRQVIVHLDQLTGFFPLHEPESVRRTWWRGPFDGPNGLGLLPRDDDASICFHNQAAEVFPQPKNAFIARTTVGFFIGSPPCESRDLKARQELSVVAPPNGERVCSDWWRVEDSGDSAEAQICLRNERIDPRPIAAPVDGNAGTAPFNATWDMSPSIIDGPAPTWTWAWGDGSTTPGGIVASHIYANPGVYTVTLTIEDQGITRSAEVGVVTVHAPASGPQAAITATSSRNLTVTFDASASQGTGRQGGAIAEYWWDLGDGTQVITRSSEPTLTHRYAQAGTYTASVTIHTANGLTATASTTVTVGRP